MRGIVATVSAGVAVISKVVACVAILIAMVVALVIAIVTVVVARVIAIVAVVDARVARVVVLRWRRWVVVSGLPSVVLAWGRISTRGAKYNVRRKNEKEKKEKEEGRGGKKKIKINKKWVLGRSDGSGLPYRFAFRSLGGGSIGLRGRGKTDGGGRS